MSGFLRCAVVLGLLLMLCGGAHADWLTDAVAADNRGDYAAEFEITKPEAEKGDGIAQFWLAMMYDNGEGVAQDYIKAHALFNMSAANGNDAARKNRDFVASKMPPDQIAKAQELASKCIAQNYKNCGF